jgi:hypothetical protein
VKVGHTNCLERRQEQYTRCDETQTHVWMFHYDAQKRYVAGE